MYDKVDENELIKAQKLYQHIKRISSLVLDIFSKNPSGICDAASLTNLIEYKSEISEMKKKCCALNSENQDLIDHLYQRLYFFLVESVHKQTSVIIRELITDIFGIEFRSDDFSLIDCIFPLKDYPKIFTKKLYSGVSINSLIQNPQEKELKETSELFTTYESQYPYSKETSLEALLKMTGTNGRLKIYEGFLLWFSDYFNLYENSLQLLMSQEDYMPITWKYYIAIMAVSTIRCEYLLRELEMQFLLKGGDETWLMLGLNAIPEKLRQLGKINNILAHQPWKLKIQDLTEIHSKFNSKGWHINELIHAVLIMTNYHRLAAVVESMRLNVKEFEEEGTETTSISGKEQNESKILKYVNEENVKKIIISELEIINKTEMTATTTHKRTLSEDFPKLNTSFESMINSSNCKVFTKHISSYCTIYLDFDSHSEEYASYIEFNWQDHGSYILQNFHPDGVDAIDAEIEYITTISSNNIGGDTKKLDTAQYRHTICCYVEKIFGYVNESFDYSKTNKLLHRIHKQFIKNIACSPQKISKTDVGVLKVTFSPEEIFHIILLVSVSKMRLQLTFFTKHLYDIINSID